MASKINACKLNGCNRSNQQFSGEREIKSVTEKDAKLIPPPEKKFSIKKNMNNKINTTENHSASRNSVPRPTVSKSKTALLPPKNQTIKLSENSKNVGKLNREKNFLNKRFEINQETSNIQEAPPIKVFKEAQEKNQPDLKAQVNQTGLIVMNGDCMLSTEKKILNALKECNNEEIDEIKKQIWNSFEKGFQWCNILVNDVQELHSKLSLNEFEGGDKPNLKILKDVLVKIISTESQIVSQHKDQEKTFTDCFQILNDIFENLQKKLESKMTENSILEDSITNKLENLQNELIKSADKYKLEIGEVTQKLNEKEIEMKDDKKRIKDLEVKVKAYNEKIVLLESNLKDNDINSKIFKENIMSETISLTNKIQSKEAKIVELTKEIDHNRINYEEHLNNVKSKYSQLKELIKERSEQFREEAQNQKRNEQNLKETIKNLEQKIQEIAKTKECYEKYTNTFDSKEFETKSNNDIKLKSMEDSNKMLKEKVGQLETLIFENSTTISNLKEKINSDADFISNNTRELDILRESECNKNHEIENLKFELNKCKIAFKQHEETILIHQRLLKIRTELIDSLQQKEVSTRNKMDCLYSQLTNQILIKSDEFQNIYSTLSAKQAEITKQEQLIKSLEENNLKNEKLRIKQEVIIKHLEDEIKHLRHVIKYSSISE